MINLANTTVWYGLTAFNVSTINRESSAVMAYGSTYAETIAWTINPETKRRDKIIGQGESCTDSLHENIRAVKCLAETGRYQITEEA